MKFGTAGRIACGFATRSAVRPPRSRLRNRKRRRAPHGGSTSPPGGQSPAFHFPRRTLNLAPMSDLVPVRRALLSVSDKTGLVDFARAIHEEFGVELISTGGTAKALREAKLPVADVSDVTGFPEMMDGRVKTLHPKIHGGLLSLRDDPAHAVAMDKHGIRPIDLVCVNLYPFERTVRRPGVTLDEAIENIDIGGPSMIRSAAKNHRWVL